MIYNLALTLTSQPEVVERVLRVTRHRGFKVTHLDMQLGTNGTTHLDMVVDSERALELLSHQLTKLIDVTELIDMTECKASPVKAAAQTYSVN
ncbi:acetolactate synthase 2 small subunit [Shewanella sp. AS1]|uniref:acetolactate synthase 2 small subunit n=1 Tax=Shewanella sp. AS1 TaxID=2907626 RepID=UPI001F2A08AC|nr:acetolactate synthase 2 small subunit [Shewanella sp. AS1]MCE9680267.1 acetolactate synthase 2 small subunit [Shewanella sp. AS1]